MTCHDTCCESGSSTAPKRAVDLQQTSLLSVGFIKKHLAGLESHIDRARHALRFEKSKYRLESFFDSTPACVGAQPSGWRQLFADPTSHSYTITRGLGQLKLGADPRIYNSEVCRRCLRRGRSHTSSKFYVSIHPVASNIEILKDARSGGYYPAPYLTNYNLEFYEDAYDMASEKIIDT